MHPFASDLVIAAFVTGSFAMATVALPIYIKNKRSMKKVSAEEFIENFMKRQEQEIEHKNQVIRDMESTIKKYDATIKKLEGTVYKKDQVIKQLKNLTKELKDEVSEAKNHINRLTDQLEQMKVDYKEISGRRVK